jgi:hypothetical protein
MMVSNITFHPARFASAPPPIPLTPADERERELSRGELEAYLRSPHYRGVVEGHKRLLRGVGPGGRCVPVLLGLTGHRWRSV